MVIWRWRRIGKVFNIEWNVKISNAYLLSDISTYYSFKAFIKKYQIIANILILLFLFRFFAHLEIIVFIIQYLLKWGILKHNCTIITAAIMILAHPHCQCALPWWLNAHLLYYLTRQAVVSAVFSKTWTHWHIHPWGIRWRLLLYSSGIPWPWALHLPSWGCF